MELPIPNIGEPVNELANEAGTNIEHQIKQEFVELNADDFGKMVQIMDDNNDQADQDDLEQMEPRMDHPLAMAESLESSNAGGSKNVSIGQQENLAPNEPILDETTENQLESSNGASSMNDSDIVLLSFEGEFPKPMHKANDDLVKREKDSISGNLSFADRVSIFYAKLPNKNEMFF